MEFYTHTALSSRLIRITDSTGVCCYLALGSRRACLLDAVIALLGLAAALSLSEPVCPGREASALTPRPFRRPCAGLSGGPGTSFGPTGRRCGSCWSTP